jgi:hypothetical protein
MMLRTYLPLAGLCALATAGIELSAAAFTSGSANPGTSASTHADWTAPQATAGVIAKSAGGTAGYIRAGGGYHVYAAVEDTGRPASGVSTVTADVSSTTSGASSTALAAGSYSIAGASYGYRTASLTANASLAEGTYSFALTSRDGAGNSRTQTGYSVVVDNTAASAADVQTANVSGGTVGKPDQGDQVVLTFSERVEPESVLAGWSGASTNVVVRIANGGTLANDSLTIRNAANTAAVPLGSVDLGSKDFLSTTRDFGATGTASTMVQSGATITVTLGRPSGTTGTALLAGTMSWTPSSTPTDRAGNPTATTARAETGASDVDF